MKDWFLRFSLRDQVALLLLLAALGLYVLFMLVLSPLDQARSDLAARNVATAQVLQRVDAMASQIRELRSGGAARSSGVTRNLTALLNTTANQYGLAISRLQPNSRGAIQLRFESVPLEALLRWLHHLEMAQSVSVEDLSISQTSTAGVVGVTLRVAARD